jgi:hypothetical protein
MHRCVTRHWIVAVFAWAVAIGPREARAEVILGPQQFGTDIGPYFRFTGGYPDNAATTTNNPSFYLSTLDFSGVGWRLPGIFGAGGSAGWNIAMIDSIHFVGAWHVAVGGNLNIGDTVNFRPAGTSSLLTRTVANLQNVPNADGSTSDVLLGTLNASFAAGSGIAAYPLTPTATYPQVLYPYGRQSEVGQNNVSGTQSGINFPIDSNPAHNEVLDALLYDYDQPPNQTPPGYGNPDSRPSTVGNNEAHLNSGDSGGPTFVLIGGQLQLVGTHAAVLSYGDIGYNYTTNPPPPGFDDNAYSADSYLPDYAATIALMTAVPEPSSLTFGVLAAAGGLTGFIRSRRRPSGK